MNKILIANRGEIAVRIIRACKEMNIKTVAVYSEVHPGFGFLSENSQFAKICEESNIKFIGPSYEVIERMGNKSNAKELMKSAGVPVIPGSDGSVKGLKDAIKTADKIGYPVMLKAAARRGRKRNSYSEFTRRARKQLSNC